MRSQTDAKGKAYMLDGAGQTIAIVDSGIDTTHQSCNLSGKMRVSKDFTGEGITSAPFGHGTHVAAIAAGFGDPTKGMYEGIAPKASLLNLRVGAGPQPRPELRAGRQSHHVIPVGRQPDERARQRRQHDLHAIVGGPLA